MCAAAGKPRATWARRPRSKLKKLNTTNAGRMNFKDCKKSEVTQSLVFPEKVR